jgi:N-sulfoglucosamine sulfohydrolase
VASLVASLDAAGETENTLVIVTSDHGMPFPRIKGHTYDSAHRVPLVVRWPAGIVHSGRRVEAFTSAIDFAPTILDCFGLDGAAAGMRPIAGTSLIGVLHDVSTQPKDRSRLMPDPHRRSIPDTLSWWSRSTPLVAAIGLPGWRVAPRRTDE